MKNQLFAMAVSAAVLLSQVGLPLWAATTKGSGAPSGPHYNLNIIGVPKDKTATMESGHRIFVPLEGNTQIMLAQGEFEVLDGNGTDGRAEFQLPNPDPDNTGTTSYSVYARALGKPGGQSETTTCATDPATGETYCSVESMVQVRGKGKSSFTNVSKELLTVYADVDGDGKLDRMSLFDPALENYYWEYDNNGMKIVQLRFYQQSTTVGQ
ncbi:MAG: hypothetical protein HY548_05550 [Elusimicrobia bacterium]|nr:hypothetical protein [Elusimicrobiota bacterium]